jgi:ABC-type phosphate transport system permease subunit
MHVGFYVLCGCPSLVLATDKKLNYYFFNNREIRLFSLLFLYLTSLINPILTLARVPLFVKTIKQIVQKHVRRVTINPQWRTSAQNIEPYVHKNSHVCLEALWFSNIISIRPRITRSTIVTEFCSRSIWHGAVRKRSKYSNETRCT